MSTETLIVICSGIALAWMLVLIAGAIYGFRNFLRMERSREAARKAVKGTGI